MGYPLTRRARETAIRVHRWLSLAAILFWVMQALTGILIVFHWELEDRLIAGPHRATDVFAIERRLATLVPAGTDWRVESVWTTGGTPDRYDVYLEDVERGLSRTVRIDGAGATLRTLENGEGGTFDTLVSLHHNLLAGEAGSWIVGASGVLLVSNLLLALTIGWPRRGMWKRTLIPPKATARPARLHGWHRAIGLWGAIPAVALASAGTLLVFGDGVSRLLDPTPVEIAAAPSPEGSRIGFAQAATIALARYPGAKLADVTFPQTGDADWRVRLRVEGEARRAYGRTTLFVSRHDGAVLGDFPASRASPARAFVDGMFPFHTGELGGTPGRLVVLATGLWLLAMAALGVMLWSARRRNRR